MMLLLLLLLLASVHLNSSPATFLIGGGGGDATKLPPLRWPLQIPHWFLGFWPQKRTIVLIGQQ